VAHAFAEVLRNYCVEHKKPYVITPSQLGVLSVLYDSDGITLGTISQKHGIDAPTVTGIIKRMEQSGLVERRHDREDRRVVKVYLTDEAKRIKVTLSDAALSFDGVVRHGFSPVEQQDMLVNLQQIIVNVSTVAPNTGDRFGLLPERI
jgi:DNA-binding MarR family transcriptional regulator